MFPYKNPEEEKEYFIQQITRAAENFVNDRRWGETPLDNMVNFACFLVSGMTCTKLEDMGCPRDVIGFKRDEIFQDVSDLVDVVLMVWVDKMGLVSPVLEDQET